jgi:hypothetical protein
MDRTAERVARNDAIFRDANEQIARRAVVAGMSKIPFLCECAEEACTTILRLTIDEYEAVRADGRRFVVAPRHEDHAGGHAEVVGHGDGYVVVEKIGEAAAIVEALDPRRDERGA